MKLSRRRKAIDYKKRIMFFSLFFIMLFISIGYAYLSTSLTITGHTVISANSWDIHFENLGVSAGSVVATTPATIQSDNTTINYSVLLSLPTDYYEFGVDVVNAGTIPGKVSLSSIQGITTQDEEYLDVTIKYDYGASVQVNDLLNPGTRKRIIVRVAYKSNLNNIPQNGINLDLTYNLNCDQTTEEDGTIENLLENLAADNACITKYNGDVSDINFGSPQTATKVYFDKCSDKRNVIFGGYCWQVVRSTESGGLKMAFNGKPVDGKCEANRNNHLGLTGVFSNAIDLSGDDYVYGTGFTYNGNAFTLTNTATFDYWPDGVGMYTCVNLTGTCSTLYYVQSYFSNTEAAVYGLNIGSVNYATIAQVPFASSSYKYSPPSAVGYMTDRFYVNEMSPLSGSIKFGTDFTYENNNYILAGTTSTISSNYDTIINGSNKRYTCWNTSGVCEELSYVYEIIGTTAYYDFLIFGQDITDYIGVMNSSDAINNSDSIAKVVIENWYEGNLLKYNNRIESTIYCNDRRFEFSNYGITTFGTVEPLGSLVCPSEMDQFKYQHYDARLKYPIAMLSASEWYNLGSDSLRSIGVPYWTMTPSASVNMSAFVGYIDNVGGLTNNYNSMIYKTDDSLGVRPAISLLSSDFLVGGTGSEADPWIIE